MRHLTIIAASLLVGLTLPNLAPASAQEDNQASIVAGELGTIAAYLQTHPEMALDFTQVSGEYCFNTWAANGDHMTHFAVDPSATGEDVIDFVNADELIEAAVELAGLPRLPSELGAMKPGQWYFLPAGEFDPHHGISFSIALLIRASNIE